MDLKLYIRLFLVLVYIASFLQTPISRQILYQSDWRTDCLGVILRSWTTYSYFVSLKSVKSKINYFVCNDNLSILHPQVCTMAIILFFINKRSVYNIANLSSISRNGINNIISFVNLTLLERKNVVSTINIVIIITFQKL